MTILIEYMYLETSVHKKIYFHVYFRQEKSMQPFVILALPTSTSNILIILLTRFIKETTLKIQAITTNAIRSHEKKPITFANHSKLGDLLRQQQEASANLASLLADGHQTVNPIIDYCFFEGEDLKRLLAHKITHGRRLLKLSEEDLL